MNKPAQIRAATVFVADDPKRAIKVLRGVESAPPGLLHNSIYIALSEYADSIDDVNMITDIASLRSTRYGQEISILTEAKKNDPVKYVSELRKRRIEAFAETHDKKRGRKANLKSVAQTVKSEVNAIKNELSKSKPSKGDWGAFIASIKC